MTRRLNPGEKYTPADLLQIGLALQARVDALEADNARLIGLACRQGDHRTARLLADLAENLGVAADVAGLIDGGAR